MPIQVTVSDPPNEADSSRASRIVAALEQLGQLHGLAPHELEWLAVHGTEIFAEAGKVIFRDGDPADSMVILLKGEIHVRREQGGSVSFLVGRSGQITGLLPFSRMKSYGGIGYAVADAWGLEIHRSLFPQMLAAIPSMADRCVIALLDRVREATRIEQQAEKLSALGKLAANLAHELNNPASAAQRAASGMLNELRNYGEERFKLGKLCLRDDEAEKIRAWETSIRARSRNGDTEPSMQSAREDAILGWLRRHQVRGAHGAIPELAECGVLSDDLDRLRNTSLVTGSAAEAATMSPSTIATVLSQFASSLRVERMAGAMLSSTARIFELIRAIKDYSYMDQAPIQEIDIPQSLENTLAMFASRTQDVRIVRDYEPDLPTISAYGSELNQVWTALIENALDAIEDRGQIQLAVHISGDLILAEITDSGPGIPPEMQSKVLEPFFTTKPPGFGLGLGLDTVNRIVRIHRGYVGIDSRPGHTCFQIRLPIQQLQAY